MELKNTWEDFCRQYKIPSFSKSSSKDFTIEDVKYAYYFGLKRASNNDKRIADFAAITEKLFHQIHMHRCITLNGAKVMEALDLIDQYSRCCDIHGDHWEEAQATIVEKMRAFI